MHMNTPWAPWAWISLLSLLLSGCSHDNASPSTTTTTTSTSTSTPASPTISSTFTGDVPVAGTTFFTFTVEQYGTVNVTLASISGVGVPSTVQMRLGIGAITETSCTASSSDVVRPGTTAHLSVIREAGLYCVNVTDVGNLFREASVTVIVDHP